MWARAMIGLAVVGVLAALASCRSSERANPARSPTSAPVGASVRYLELLHSRLELTREQIPEMVESAELAAARLHAGGRIYVAGSQPEFASELLDRAGGLAMLERVPARVSPNDVILYGARSRLSSNDLSRISSWRASGLCVVAFASRELSSNPFFRPDFLIDSGPTEGLPLRDGTICPSDTTMNIANAWAWTGEFFGACVRRGRAPVMNQSFLAEGGYARAARYRNRAFHDDLKIAPVRPGALAGAYLDKLERCLARLEGSSDALTLAGAWVAETMPARRAVEVLSNTFPLQMEDDRSPRVFGAMSGAGATWPPRSAGVVVAIQYVAPKQLLIDASHDRRTKLIYSSVVRGQDDRSRNIVYIDPCYPSSDACVQPAGYDIPILPASAVVQSAIYWSIVAEATGVAAPRRR